MTEKSEFRQKLAALIGQPTGGSGKPTLAPDPVNQPMIRHWAHALDDMNPVYLDSEFAEKSRFGGIVSPPVMLHLGRSHRLHRRPRRPRRARWRRSSC